MKILRKGEKYGKVFVGRIIRCRDCKSILQVERKDLKKSIQVEAGDREIYCPVCGINNNIKDQALCGVTNKDIDSISKYLE